MADMTLNKPEAGAQNVVNAQPDARLQLNFPAADATLERSGDDLIFRFDDGSSLVLRDFYTSYTRENMPDFVIDGTPVTGEDFFAALNNEDLMPAAGPAANASNADGGRYREYSDDPLQVGVDRLGGLDLNTNRAFSPERDPWGGLREDGASSLPNRGPGVNIVGGVGVAEAGVHPGGNDPYQGVPLVTGRVVATDDDGDVLAYGFIDASGQRVTTIATEHGSITIAQDGTFTYTLDNADPDTNGLALGETATETFTVFVDDGRGGFTTQPITVTITGTNDRPELSVTGSGQGVVEDGAQSVTGTFAVADPDSDAGRDQTFHIDSANGGTGTDGTRGENGSSDASFSTDYGTLTLNPATGQWEYTLNNTGDAVQQLKEGDTRTETFTVTVTDEHGATSQQEISVTITGTNDAPVISGTDDLSLKETGVQDGGNTPTAEGDAVTATGNEHKLIATGKIDASDIDSDDDASTLDYKLQDADGKPADSIETGYGTVNIGKDGTYTYELKDGTANHLAQGESVTETITVMVTDRHGETVTKDVTVTIYGTNDQPTLSLSATTLDVVESGVGRDGDGNVVDKGTPAQENAAYKGQISAGGTAKGDDADDSASLTFGLKGADGDPQYAENGPVTSGGAYGDLTINQDGSYTYVLRDGELDQLNEGEKQSETFTVYVRDEHGAWAAQEITVTITGTNDLPVLDIKGSGQTIEEDGKASTVGGDFTITDPDADGIHQTITIEGDKDTPGTPTEGSRGENTSTDATFTTDYGKLTLNPATGKWEYQIDNTSDAVQKLGEGESKTETFTVTVTDEHGATSQQPITVTITGTNDAPVVDGYTDALTLKEAGVGQGGDPNAPVEGVSTVTGRVEAHDVDANDPNLSYSLTAGDKTDIISSATDANTGVQTIVTQYGTLVLTPGAFTADGKPSYTYTLDQTRADALNAGQKHEENFTLTVADGHGGTAEVPIHVTIEGTNDRPELTIDNAVQGVKEDSGTYTVNGTFIVTDADADGAFGGQTNSTANQRYSIAGGTAESGDVTSGTATNSPDAGGPATFTNEYGMLTVNPDGTWTYELDNDSKTVQALKEGETRTETFNVTVTDVHGANHTQPITVTITGTNEVPTIQSVTEHVKDVGVFGKGVLGDEDYITPNTATGDYSDPGTDGHIKDNEQRTGFGGQLQGFDAEGDPLTYGMKTDGLTPDSTLTLTNPDDPTETTTIKVLGVTSTDAITIIVTEVGTFSVSANGSYEFALATTKGGFVDKMAQGEKWNLTFNMTASDGKDTGEAKLTICIEGTNKIPTLTLDKPTLEVVESGVGRDAEGNVVDNTDNNPETDGNENAPYVGKLTASGKATGADVDNGATLTYGFGDKDGKNQQYAENGNDSVTSGGGYGTLTVYKDGTYSYTLDDSKANTLHEGELTTDTFIVYVKDEHGAYTSEEVTVNITGTNDAPVLSVTGSGQSVVEDKDDAQSVTGTFAVADPDKDAGKDQTFTIQGGKDTSAKPGVDPTEGSHSENSSSNATFTTDYGTLTLNPATGKWEYQIDNTSDAVQSLAQDETKTETFTVTVTDEHGATSTETITVEITGTNDTPKISHSKVHVREEGVAPGGNTETTADDKDDGYVDPKNHREVVEGTLSASDPDSDAKLTFGIDVTSKKGGINEGGITVQRYTNSGPVLDSGGNPVTETLTITSNTMAVDPATGHNIQTISTNYGTLTLDTVTGHYTFELSTDAANHLPQGEKFDFYFTTTVTDQYGAQHSHMLGVTVEGANDRPDLTLVSGDSGTPGGWSIVADGKTGDASITMKEGEKVTGKVDVDDPDAGGKQGERFTYAVDKGDKGNDILDNSDLETAEGHKGTVDGDYGTLTINADGTYTYTAHDDLAQGHKYTEEFTIFVKDEHGAWDAQTVTVTVEGSADAPVIKGALPDAHVAEYTEAGVVFKENKDKDDSIDGPGTSEAADGSFILGTFVAQQTDSQADASGGKGELIAGFVVDGKFYAGELHTDYGTLTITIGEDGTATYSFVPPAEGTPEAAKLDSLTDAERIELSDELGGLKVGVYDSAHAGLVQKDSGHDKGGDYFTIADGTLIPTQDVDFYIRGSNDRPYFTDGEGNELGDITVGTGRLAEDGQHFLTGELTADDPDKDHNPGDLSYSIVLDGKLVQVAEGKYGTLELYKDGTYTYTITHPERLDALNPGQSLIESALADEIFDIRVTDPDNAFTDGKLTIDVTGTEDRPVINEGKLDISEDNGADINHTPTDPSISDTLTLTGIVDAEDVGNVTWSGKGQVGYADGSGNQPLGTLTVNADGTYTYTLTKNGSDLVQAMNEGQIKTETFKVQAQIEGGKTVEKDITVTIHGTNDKPVITAEQATFAGEVTRDVFDDNDPTDMGEGVTTGVIFKGELKGGASDVDNADVKYMLVGADGQPVSELKTEFGTITLTHTVNEDGSISTGYTYTLDNDSQKLIDALKEKPDDLFDKVEIVAVDPLGAVSDEKGTINIKINPGKGDGTGPDAIVIDPNKSDLTANVTEDGTKDDPNTPDINEGSTAHGKLEAMWAPGSEHTGDAPDRVFGIEGADHEQVQGHVAVDGKYGYLVVNPVNGEYTYTLYNGENGNGDYPVQDLAAGEKGTETFQIMLNGKPTGEHLTITVHGTNDAPTIENVTQSSDHIDEDLTQGWTGTVTGTVQGTDIDHFQNADGTFNTGKTETVTYKFATHENVTVGNTSEDGNPTLILTIEGKGTVVLDTVTGKYTFTVVDPDIGHIVAGESEKVDFQIVATDGKADSEPADITIDLKGVNHAPEVEGGPVDIHVTEDAVAGETTGGLSQTGDLKGIVSDDKGVDNLSFAVDGKTVAQGEYGTLVINKDGTYTYTLNNADDKVQGLDAAHSGENAATESFTITVTDSDGKTADITVNVTVTGKDDAPQVTVGEVIKAVEGSEEAYTGKVTAYDKDTADQAEGALTYAFDAKAVAEHNAAHPEAQWTLNADGTLTTEYGTYTIDQNGNYTFTLDNEADAVRKLAAGTLTEQKVTVAVTDHDSPPVTQEVTVNISGQNTAPDFTDADGNRIPGDTVTLEANTTDSPLVEAEGAEVTGRFGFTDPDDKGTVDGISVNGTAISAEGTVITGTYGTLTINPDGSYTYAYTSDALAEGEPASETFTVKATDNYGASSTAELVVNLQGTNDAPTASGGAHEVSLPSMLVPSSLYPGGDVPSVTGRLADSDPDGDSLTYTAGSLTGTYGNLVLNDDGSYAYTLDMSGDNLVELVMQRGETLAETFTYTVNDGHGGTSEGHITVNLNVPDDFSTVTYRGAASFGHTAGNDDAAHASGGENPHETDSLDTHNTDGGNPLHTDGPDAHAASNVLGTDTLSGPGADSDTLHTDGPSEPDADGNGLLGANGLFGTDGLDGPDADKTLHTDGPAQTGTGDAAHDAGNGGHDAASSHAQSALSGGESADYLLGASPFTEDDFGDQDIFGTAAHEVFSPAPHTEGFYADLGGLAEAGQLLEAPDNSLDGVLAPSEGLHGTDGPSDLGLTSLQPGEDLGGGSMPGLVPAETMPDSPDMALVAGAPIPGAEDNLAHQQAMHEVNHSNG